VILESIDDAGDARLADYRDLRSPGRRPRDGGFVVESRLAVRRLVAAGRYRVRSLLVTPPTLDALADVSRRLPEDTPVFVARHPTIKAVVGFDFHRGCLAVGERRAVGPAFDAVLSASGHGPLVACERIAQEDNVGAVFRNALAFGARGVLLSPGCADPLSRKAIRVSLGATLAMPWAEVEDWPAGLDRLRADHATILAFVARADAVPIEAVAARALDPRRLVLLFGTEGEGLSSAATARADAAVTIPIAATVDSLNVATATGIALHRLAAR
jgi:tRNA G18 (ribose-2'-O)-methylase SpoU